MRLIFGVDPRNAGRLRLDGAEADIRGPRQAMRLGIGYMPEDRKQQGLFLDLYSRPSRAPCSTS